MIIPLELNIQIPKNKDFKFNISVENESFDYEKISVLQSSCSCTQAINVTETVLPKSSFNFQFIINRVSEGKVNVTFFNHKNAEQKSVILNVTINE